MAIKTEVRVVSISSEVSIGTIRAFKIPDGFDVNGNPMIGITTEGVFYFETTEDVNELAHALRKLVSSLSTGEKAGDEEKTDEEEAK